MSTPRREQKRNKRGIIRSIDVSLSSGRGKSPSDGQWWPDKKITSGKKKDPFVKKQYRNEVLATTGGSKKRDG